MPMGRALGFKGKIERDSSELRTTETKKRAVWAIRFRFHLVSFCWRTGTKPAQCARDTSTVSANSRVATWRSCEFQNGYTVWRHTGVIAVNEVRVREVCFKSLLPLGGFAELG